MTATWNGAVLAKSDDTVMVEGNHYFPPDLLNQRFLQESSKRSTCPWKGQASYCNISVDGDVNPDAAWTYRAPSQAAGQIKDHVAFWRGVRIEHG